MNRRRFALVIGAIVCGVSLPAQTRSRRHRIGVLLFSDRSDVFAESFGQGLRDHGYHEGQDLIIEWRFAGGSAERAAELARELVSLDVEVIVASLTAAVLAARQATSTIPIVMAPAGTGIVKNLARPEANVTGVSGASAELSGKRLELLREMIPGLNRVAVLINGADAVFGKRMLSETLAAARGEVDVRAIAVDRPGNFEPAFASFRNERIVAVIVQPSLVIRGDHASKIAALGLRDRVALTSQSPEFAEAGGLLSYGANFRERYRFAAAYVAKLLNGAKPGDLPVDMSQRFEVIVNAATAKALGLTLPASVLLRADRVIE